MAISILLRVFFVNFIFVCQLVYAQSSVDDAALLKYWVEHPKSPTEYVIDTFNKGKRWVILGEFHRVKHDVQLVLDLIPALHRRTGVRCIAFEFISAEGTKEANRLVTQKTFDRAKALDFFKRQVPDWCYNEYFSVLETVWRSNCEVGESRGMFGIVGLGAGTDWEIVNYGNIKSSKKELIRQHNCDEFMGKTLEKEVMKKNISALIYVGDAHAVAKYKAYWVGTSRQLVRMGNYVHREPYMPYIWTIKLHAPVSISGGPCLYPFDGRLDRLMVQYGKAIGFDVNDTPFGIIKDSRAKPYTRLAYSFGELVDGYIMHPMPILEYEGVTRIKDWVSNEKEYRWFWRHFPSKSGSRKLSKMSLEEYQEKADEIHDAGGVFKRRMVQWGIRPLSSSGGATVHP